jgi:hypothetical protein
MQNAARASLLLRDSGGGSGQNAMALLDRNDTNFRTSVLRKWHWDSGRLNRLLAALEDFQKHPTSGDKLQYLHKRLWRWRQENPKEFAKRGARFDELLGEIQAKAGRLRVALVVPDAGGAGSNAHRVVMAAKPELDRCKDFTSSDAGNFANSINPALKDTVLARSQQHRVKTGMAVSNLRGDTTWKARHLKDTKDSVYGARAGECTSFAKAGAHILAAQRAPLPRIELVGWEVKTKYKRPNTKNLKKGEKPAKGWQDRPGEWIWTNMDVAHVFCIVGREGGYVDPRAAKKQLPPYAQWQGDWHIVDPWAGAMGWSTCYRANNNYPFNGMLSPVYLQMEYEGD